MNGINKVILVGNLGTNPNVKRLESGTLVAKIRIATTEYYRNRNGERMENTEWHSVTLWRSLAELAEKYLQKGSKVYIEGKLRNRDFEDKDGNRRRVTEIEADNLIIFDKKINKKLTQDHLADVDHENLEDYSQIHDEEPPFDPDNGFEPSSSEDQIPY